MKSYTDIEQSRKLVDILSTESADMHYNDWSYDFLEGYEHTGRYKVDLGTPKTICGELDIPCWSLAALINALPSSTLDSSRDHYCRIHCMGRFTEWYENSVDACVAMIKKLHELKML